MKKIISFIIVLITITVSAQNKPAKDLYNKGVESFDKKDYKIADSLFTLSAKLEPNADTYFNIAATKNELGDRCGFCEYMKVASKYGDRNATKFYFENCIKTDTIKYIGVQKDSVSYYCVVSTKNCINEKTYKFYKKYQSKDSLYPISVLRCNDSIRISEKEFLSPTFDIENHFQEWPDFIFMDEMPQFPGGEKERLKFIQDNIKYPKEAIKNEIHGVVYISFIIEETGELSNIEVIQGIGGGCDEEALRVIRMMPDWIPAKRDGCNVRVFINCPIRF